MKVCTFLALSDSKQRIFYFFLTFFASSCNIIDYFCVLIIEQTDFKNINFIKITYIC